jgi:RNA polymerase sigma-70 factor, ECF subfamily
LVDVEEFTYLEASEILRVPLGTVMSRVSRARKVLRGQLAHVARAYGVSTVDP